MKVNSELNGKVELLIQNSHENSGQLKITHVEILEIKKELWHGNYIYHPWMNLSSFSDLDRYSWSLSEIAVTDLGFLLRSAQNEKNTLFGTT